MSTSTRSDTTTTTNTGTLIAQLAEQGIKHLRSVQYTGDYEPTDNATLIAKLAGHSEPRLREALIPLFLRHPEYAQFVPPLVAMLDAEAALRLRHLYTASVYLQRFWHTTLEIYLGKSLPLPDYYGQSYFHLPPPADRFGEAGLRALATHFKQVTGFDWLTVYDTAISLFLKQLSLERYSPKAKPKK